MRNYFLFALFLLVFRGAEASNYAEIKDSTVSFKVQGVCMLCKKRIEAAVRVTGVSSAEWSEETKVLRIVYSAAWPGLQAIHRLLADAGHDTELERAADAVYGALPECCHYRQGAQSNPGRHVVRGVVLEENKKGEFNPLVGASVIWLGTNTGGTTDSSGVFRIPMVASGSRLVISYAGYRSDTLEITDTSELKLILASGKELAEVRVSNRQRSTYLSSISPIRTQVMSERELFKAACCNLSESFETNPSVDVAYNDAVTGSRQIQLLGLSGIYTQLTVENLPGPRGLATPFGLSFIPGPWIESIQISKGTGSVVNGYESMAGQINVELKKPEKADRLYANMYVNSIGRVDMNLNLSQRLGKKWSTLLLLHNDLLRNRVDEHGDGFRDLPTGNQFSLVNRWKFEGNEGFQAQFGWKLLTDDRTGGEMDFDPGLHKYSYEKYGAGFAVRRYEAFAKLGYVFPEKKFKSVGLQLSAFSHNQDAYFGTRTYHGEQQNFYANLIYQSVIGNSNHRFRTGASLVADGFDERFVATDYRLRELVAGAFFEYSLTVNEQLSLVSGIRADRNNISGWFVTPRLHVRYEPAKGSVLRLSAGRGRRTAHPFADHFGLFMSARQVSMVPAAYHTEIAWTAGLSFDQKFRLSGRDATFALEYFHTAFTEQLVAGLQDPRRVVFQPLDGPSWSNSLQAELNGEPFPKFEVRLAWRWFDVRTTYDGELLRKPLSAKHRAFLNLAYVLGKWSFDYTANFIGPKRIPPTGANPPEYRRPQSSQAYFIMNSQITRTLGKKKHFDLYLGVENLTNFFQKDPIIAADQPFSDYFDASIPWGPVSGRLVYSGFRFRIK